jgi:Methylase involved in ubiquinone/menaquinone biosynthesis
MEDNQSTTENLLKMYAKQDLITSANYWLLYLLSAFRTAPRNARVLDCGCALGVFITFLKRRGFAHVEGFDASPEMVEAGRAITGCEIKIADILDLDRHYEPASFDIVSVSNILHHVTDIKSWGVIFAGIRHILSPNGLLVIREPKRTLIYRTLEWLSAHPACYVGPLKFRLQSIIEERAYLDYFFSHWYAAHVELLKTHGFEIISEGTSMGEQVLSCRRG